MKPKGAWEASDTRTYNMAIDISNDNRLARLALERAKAFCDRVRKKKTVYSISINGVTMCSTSKADIDHYVESVTPVTKRKDAKEIKNIPLEEVNKLRKTMPLGQIIKKMGLDMTVNSLRVALMNGGYIKTMATMAEEKAKRNKKIKELYEKGYTYGMIQEKLKLDIKASTIERICKDWDS